MAFSAGGVCAVFERCIFLPVEFDPDGCVVGEPEGLGVIEDGESEQRLGRVLVDEEMVELVRPGALH